MRKDTVLEVLKQFAPFGAPKGITTNEIAQKTGILRHNVSSDLNELCREGLVVKSKGRPVEFWTSKLVKTAAAQTQNSLHGRAVDLEGIIGTDGSLKMVLEQAKASIMYPGNGLAALIVGPTGVGKSFLAEAMYKYAVNNERLKKDAPFSIFNCADYASNPQLLLAQLFGYVRGAFTGADKDSPGIIAKTEGGILFLDEVHRLPPEGQEMLFLLMDKGIYRCLGDSATTKNASVRIIAATSEDPQSVLLKTFQRRFPVIMYLPSLNNRPLKERLALIDNFFKEEASRIGAAISVSPLALAGLLVFHTTGNIGELRSVIQLSCAKAFLNYIADSSNKALMHLYITDMSTKVQLAYFAGNEIINQAEKLIGPDDRLYYPMKELDIASDNFEEHVPYNNLKKRIEGYLQSGLKQYEIEQLIDTEIRYYMQKLMRFHKKESEGCLLVKIHDAVHDFIENVEKELGYKFDKEIIDNLALYLASSKVYSAYTDFDSTTIIDYCTKEYLAVKQFAAVLEQGMKRPVSQEEVIFISMFLSSHKRDKIQKPAVNIIVICHGNNTASSMAEVANSLIGNDRIIAIDMPLDQSVEKTFEITIERIRQANEGSGILLLVDMGSLTNFKPLIEKMLSVKVEAIPLVTTAAVIEAARLAGESDMTLSKIAKNIKGIYKIEETNQVENSGKKVVITTCLTGKGTARKLVTFLYEGLPPELREKIVIQAIDVENGSEVSGLMIDGWKGSIAAAVGTVNPHLPKVDFIGIEEILFGDGLKRFHAMLNSDNENAEYETAEVSKEEAINLACRFINESSMTGNREQASEAAVQALKQLELYQNIECTPSQAARFIIHFAFMLERISTDGSISTCSEMEYLKKNHSTLLENIKLVTRDVEQQWGIDIPSPEIGFLALILLSV